MNLISVIIPCYNAEQYVSECLYSVLNQSYKNFEIICVDDGSSDTTLNILNQFKIQYSQLITIIASSNNGASAARNIGLKAAKGNYIQFLDADDIIETGKFEKQIKVFEINNNIDIIVSDRVQKNSDLSKTIKEFNFKNIENNFLETAVRNIIITGNPLYKKEIVNKINGYDESLKSSQDWDFHIRLALEGSEIKYVPGIFFISRKVSGSLSSDWIKVSVQATEVIKKLKQKLLQSSMMNDTIKRHIAQIYMNSAIYCKDKNLEKELVKELIFWTPDFSFMNLKIKRMVASIFGLNFLVKTLRFKKIIFRKK